MKYFFSKESIENLCNANDGLRVFLIEGSSSFIKSRLLEGIAEKAYDEGLSREIFLSPADCDESVCIYIKGKNCLVCDTQYYSGPAYAVKRVNTDIITHIEPIKEKLIKLNLRKAAFLSCADKYKAAAASLQRESLRLIKPYINKPKILNYILRFASRNGFCRAESEATVQTRQLSSITAWGVHSFYESISEQSKHIFTLCGKYKGISSVLLSGLSKAFQGYGYDTVVFKCSVSGETEHLCVPSLSVAFLTDNEYHSLPYGHCGEINTQRFLTQKPSENILLKLLLNKEQADILISKAVFSSYDAMEMSNAVSDLLTDEQTQSKLHRLCAEVINEIFSDN